MPTIEVRSGAFRDVHGFANEVLKHIKKASHLKTALLSATQNQFHALVLSNAKETQVPGKMPMCRFG